MSRRRALRKEGHEVLGVDVNPTKVEMMADRGVVFWHDYGGKGRFKPLADYLEGLSRRVPIYRVGGTTLAWAPASNLTQLVSLK